jgi:hypothetical protein
MGSLLIGMVLLSGCAQEPPPEGALSVAALLKDPRYDTKVDLYGQVGKLGGLRCPCFELTSGGKTVLVWYVWYEGDATGTTSVSMEGIQNGDQVIVTGELQIAGADSPGGFWASGIETVRGGE